MSFFSKLFSRGPDPKETIRPLWHRLVGLARDPAWYAECKVADTLEGRFDILSTMIALAMLRFEHDPKTVPASARLTELFVEDMEGQLREAGIGDPTVGKKVGNLVSALGGRTGALREALAQEDNAALAAAMERNITFAEGGSPGCVAEKVRKLSIVIGGLPYDVLLEAELQL